MSDTILAQEQNNFLLPNGTFFAVLIIFLIVLGLLWRFVVPPIQQAMSERHDRVRKQRDEAERASQRFAEADQRYREALSEARNESSQIRDEARAEGNRTIEELREQANAEVARTREHAEQQLAQQRERVVSELRGSVGDLSTKLASHVVGTDVTGSVRQVRIDEMLHEWDQGTAGSRAAPAHSAVRGGA